MLSCTLQEYKDSYKTKLSAYLNEYEDNTQTSFLEKEIERYSDYTAILNKLKRTCKEEALKGTFIKNKLLGKLKKINISAYNAIISKEIKKGEQDKYESLNTDRTLIVLDFEKLKNHITSSEQIFKFINKEYRFSINSNKLHTPVDLIGELPFLSIKQQSSTPNDSIIISKEAIPKKPSKHFPAKWYALLYLLELQATNGKLPINSDGALIKQKIEEIGKQRISGSTGQSFYRNVQKFKPDIKDCNKLDRIFPDNWRDMIISLSNNNAVIIKYLKKNY